MCWFRRIRWCCCQQEDAASDEISISTALNVAIKLLQKGAGMLTQQADLMTQQADVLKGVLKKRKSTVAEADFIIEDSESSSKKVVKVVESRVSNLIYLTFSGKKPDRNPVTLTFLRTATASELYFKGLWYPEYDVDEFWTLLPERGRKFRSEVNGDYMPGYDIDDVTFGSEKGDLAKPLEVCFCLLISLLFYLHITTAYAIRV